MRFKSFKGIKETWKALHSFERTSLMLGIIMYIILPSFKAHPENLKIAGQILSPMLEALANVLFIFGALAFLKMRHEKSLIKMKN